MRYLIQAKIKPDKKEQLLQKIQNKTLGEGSVAFGEYVQNMHQARFLEDGTVSWIDVCFCQTPLNEEFPFWEEYFYDINIQNAHNPKACRDFNGKQKRACFDCNCTKKLEKEMLNWGVPFLTSA
jgi:hypothetical protein